MPEPPQQPGTTAAAALKDPGFSALLAWLVPGLGHLYQGRWAKAIVYFVCIMGTFGYGLYLGSSNDPRIGWGRVVYFSMRKDDIRLAYLCQVGVGLPALPALVQAYRMSDGKRVWSSFMAPPRLSKPVNPNDPNADQPLVSDLYYLLSRYFELGTVYTMIAGLLNVLAVYDAWGGPVVFQPRKKDEEAENDGKGAKHSSEGTGSKEPVEAGQS